MDPQGLFLWLATDSEEEELEILKRLKRWITIQRRAYATAIE